MRTHEQHDLLMGKAVPAAAEAIDAAPSFLERFVDHALGAALEAQEPGAQVILRRRMPLNDWERLPGARTTRTPETREADLQFIPKGDTRPAIVCEQKVWDFDASIFDLAKLLTFARLPGIRGTYLVGADVAQRFDSDRPGHALFADGAAKTWHLAELVAGRWQAAWMHHLHNAGIAPCRLPSLVTTCLVARAKVPAFPGHELRCIRVRAEAAPDAKFREGRLLGEEPPDIDPDFEDAMTSQMNRDSFERFRSSRRRADDL